MATYHQADPDTPWWNPLPKISHQADIQAARLNFVWRQIIDPCDAPFTVWVWAFWPAFWKLVLAWFAIDIKQIYRTAVRPKYRALHVRSRSHFGSREKHKRPGKPGSKLNPFSYDPNDWIGTQLNPYDEIAGFGPAPGELWFWSFVDVFERVAFYWMVMDLGTEFLYDWASAVSETKYCHARDDAVLTASVPGYPLIGIFGWDAVGVLTPEKMRHVAFFNGFGASLDFGPGNALLFLTATNIGGEVGAWVEVRLNCLTGPRTGYKIMQHTDVGPFGTAAMAAQCDIMGEEIWIGEARVNGSFNIINPTLQMHAVYHAPPI